MPSSALSSKHARVPALEARELVLFEDSNAAEITAGLQGLKMVREDLGKPRRGPCAAQEA